MMKAIAGEVDLQYRHMGANYSLRERGQAITGCASGLGPIPAASVNRARSTWSSGRSLATRSSGTPCPMPSTGTV